MLITLVRVISKVKMSDQLAELHLHSEIVRWKEICELLVFAPQAQHWASQKSVFRIGYRVSQKLFLAAPIWL